MLLLFLFLFSYCDCRRSCRNRYRRGASVFATATWFQAGKMSLTLESNVTECIHHLIKMCQIQAIGGGHWFNIFGFLPEILSIHDIAPQGLNEKILLSRQRCRRCCWRFFMDPNLSVETMWLWSIDKSIYIYIIIIYINLGKYCSKFTLGNKQWIPKIARPPQSYQQLQHSWRLVQVNVGSYECGAVCEGSNDDHICPYMSIAYHLFLT